MSDKRTVCPTVMLGQGSVNHSILPYEYVLFSKRHRYRCHSGQQPTSIPKFKKLNFPVQGSFKPLLSIMPVQSASLWPRMTGASAGEGKTYVCLPPCTHSLAGDSNTHSRPVASIFISTLPTILQCRKAMGLKQILFILAVVYTRIIGFSKTFNIFKGAMNHQSFHTWLLHSEYSLGCASLVFFFLPLLMKYRVFHSLG